MGKNVKIFGAFFVVTIGLLLTISNLKTFNIFQVRMQAPGTIVVPVTGIPESAKNGLQLGTFPYITATPAPTVPPGPGAPNTSTKTKVPFTTPYIGGPAAPPGYYCIDDEDPDGCDDASSFLVPKGTGGIAGTCGTVIEQAHKITKSLPQNTKAFRDILRPSVTNCSYSTGAYSSGYISTFFVIDAYNLAGYKELSKTNPKHVTGTNLLAWWKSSEAVAAGYKFIPYTSTLMQQYSTGQQDLTGCVMFLNTSSGVFPGIVNKLEIYNVNGNGVLSMLKSGAQYFLDRFIVSGWAIQNTPQHQTVIAGVAGFGCH
jgi:hypothetical protein